MHFSDQEPTLRLLPTSKADSENQRQTLFLE